MVAKNYLRVNYRIQEIEFQLRISTDQMDGEYRVADKRRQPLVEREARTSSIVEGWPMSPVFLPLEIVGFASGVNQVRLLMAELAPEAIQ